MSLRHSGGETGLNSQKLTEISLIGKKALLSDQYENLTNNKEKTKPKRIFRH